MSDGRRLPATAVAGDRPGLDRSARRPASCASTPAIPPRRIDGPRPRSSTLTLRLDRRDPERVSPDPQPTDGDRRRTISRDRALPEARRMYFDEFKHQLPDIDPDETEDWMSVARPGRRAGRRDARPVPRLQAAQARAPAPDRPAAADPDPLHQHDQPRAGARLPRRRGDGAAHPADRPLERRRDGAAGEHPVPGHRRPPLDVRQLGQPVRGRLQPLLPRQGRGGERRPDLLPGPRRARASTPARSSRAA